MKKIIYVLILVSVLAMSRAAWRPASVVQPVYRGARQAMGEIEAFSETDYCIYQTGGATSAADAPDPSIDGREIRIIVTVGDFTLNDSTVNSALQLFDGSFADTITLTNGQSGTWYSANGKWMLQSKGWQ